MKIHCLAILFILLFSSELSAQTPCDFFDHDGDGTIGADTWVYVLGQYATEGSLDLNGSGIVDVEDLLSFIPFVGHHCPAEWHDTTSNHTVDLILIEWQTHENELVGITQNIPVGSKTYRLFVHFSNPADRVLAVYGNELTPLIIETDGELYGFGNQIGETIVVQNYNPALNGFFPANEFVTWLSAGQYPVYDDDPIMTSYVSLDWTNNEFDSSSIELNDEIGGAWFPTNGGAISSAENSIESFSLIGQFTVIGGATSLEGTVNILAETQIETGHAIEFGEELTFSSNNLTVFGCTQSEAFNFNPIANFDDGSCQQLGDYDNDGLFTVSDFLSLLSDYGCVNCPQGDFNSDGVVSVQDILIFLTWI